MVNVGQCGEQQILVTNLPQKIELKKMLKNNVLCFCLRRCDASLVSK